MGLSTGKDLHIDKMLSNVAINYRPQGMIADLLFPVVNVDKEHDLYAVFSQGEALSVENTVRSRGSAARRITRSVSSAGYHVRNFALAYDVPIEDRANMDPAFAFELESGAARYLVDKLMLDWERRVLSIVSSTTNVSTAFVPNSSWAVNGSGSGDPIMALMLAMEQGEGTTGYRPNRLLFGWKAWNYIRRNYHSRNFINGVSNGGGLVTRQSIADALEVENILVSRAFMNTANEAMTNSVNLQSIFPADAIFGYYAPSGPSRETPSYGYSFRWTNPLLPTPLAVERHPYDTKHKVESIEAGYYQDEKVTGAALGFLFLGVGSAQSGGL